MNAACIILAAGNSSRMNFHKALLPFSEGENFIQHIVNVYKEAGIDKIIGVVNAETISKLGFSDKIKLIENKKPELGRLHSLQLGLSVLPETEFCFVQNVDNPFVTAELLQQLYAEKNEGDFIAPYYKGKGGHPVLISKKIIKEISETKANKQISLHDVLIKFKKKQLESLNEKIMININSMDDFNHYFKAAIK